MRISVNEDGARSARGPRTLERCRTDHPDDVRAVTHLAERPPPVDAREHPELATMESRTFRCNRTRRNRCSSFVDDGAGQLTTTGGQNDGGGHERGREHADARCDRAPSPLPHEFSLGAAIRVALADPLSGLVDAPVQAVFLETQSKEPDRKDEGVGTQRQDDDDEDRGQDREPCGSTCKLTELGQHRSRLVSTAAAPGRGSSAGHHTPAQPT